MEEATEKSDGERGMGFKSGGAEGNNKDSRPRLQVGRGKQKILEREMRSERENDFCPEPGFVRMGGIESGKAMHENTRDPSKR